MEGDRHHLYHQETHNGCLNSNVKHTASIKDTVLHHGKPVRAVMESIL